MNLINVDLRRIITSVRLTQAERLEAQLLSTQSRNEARAREMARSMGAKWVLARDYDGHYQSELSPKGAQ